MSSIKPFNKLGLTSELLESLTELGYEKPTPIQSESIPALMEGKDLLAQAQTGTGKTAAFALPILAHLDVTIKKPQAIVIAPTRELAIQVAEAFQSYAKHMKGFHVTPIYGGQDYQIQLRALKRGAHVIVGTPGRVMDHLRRKTLVLDNLKTVVLDEGDEMLKMGFIDDIEWILEQIPEDHQTALFSATMPASIQKIASRYLKNARKIQIKPTASTINSIEQFFTRVSRNQKLEVLTRFLEVEDIQAAIIFARTKNCSAELAEKLQARGYAAAALNGDMQQSLRKKVIERIKSGELDIVVATDVAARGIDVERVSHVINYDIPYDTESYIHRIGRTGRAGRKGKAILFVAPREQRLLQDIERAIHKPIKQMDPPSLKEMREKRALQLASDIGKVVNNSKSLQHYRGMVENILDETGCAIEDVAAALIDMIQQSNPLSSFEIESSEFEKEPAKGRRRSSSRSNRKPPARRRSNESSRGSEKKSSQKPKKKYGSSTKKKSGPRTDKKPAGKGKRNK